MRIAVRATAVCTQASSWLYRVSLYKYNVFGMTSCTGTVQVLEPITGVICWPALPNLHPHRCMSATYLRNLRSHATTFVVKPEMIVSIIVTPTWRKPIAGKGSGAASGGLRLSSVLPAGERQARGLSQEGATFRRASTRIWSESLWRQRDERAILGHRATTRLVTGQKTSSLWHWGCSHDYYTWNRRYCSLSRARWGISTR